MDIKIIRWEIDEEIYMEELEHHHLKSPIHQYYEKWEGQSLCTSW